MCAAALLRINWDEPATNPVALNTNERQLQITPISEGLHTFTIRALDTAAATRTASVSFLADAPLRVAIASPDARIGTRKRLLSLNYLRSLEPEGCGYHELRARIARLEQSAT